MPAFTEFFCLLEKEYNRLKKQQQPAPTPLMSEPNQETSLINSVTSQLPKRQQEPAAMILKHFLALSTFVYDETSGDCFYSTNRQGNLVDILYLLTKPLVEQPPQLELSWLKMVADSACPAYLMCHELVSDFIEQLRNDNKQLLD